MATIEKKKTTLESVRAGRILGIALRLIQRRRVAYRHLIRGVAFLRQGRRFRTSAVTKIMEMVAKETKGKSFHTYKYSYDAVGTPSLEYDDPPERVMKWKLSAETVAHKKPINLTKDVKLFNKVGAEPFVKFFLDGSRRVFKVDDLAYGKRVFPVIAAQIGVACCARDNKRMRLERFKREIVLALPSIANQGGWDDESYFGSIVLKINESKELKKLGQKVSAILPYPNASTEGDYASLAIARVQERMIEAEKLMVTELVKDERLNHNAYLLKDGSLEYKEMKSGVEELRALQRIKHYYRWVIGVSKSFNPESCSDHAGKPNSNYIADLPVFHRTPVARYENSYTGDVQFGVWYIRLRDKRTTKTPFDGVVKVERIMMDEELDSGINSDEVDAISANIINERTPVCYGADSRWANHLYPVYLTESFIKSQYLSSETFLHLF